MSDEKIQDDVEVEDVQDGDPQEDCECGCGAGAAIGGAGGQKLWKTLFFVAVIGSALAVAAHAYVNNRQQAKSANAFSAGVAGFGCSVGSGETCSTSAGAELTCPSGFDGAAKSAASAEGSMAKTGAAGMTCPSGFDGAAKSTASSGEGSMAKTGAAGMTCPSGFDGSAKGAMSSMTGSFSKDECSKAAAGADCCVEGSGSKGECSKAAAEASSAKTDEGSSSTSVS